MSGIKPVACPCCAWQHLLFKLRSLEAQLISNLCRLLRFSCFRRFEEIVKRNKVEYHAGGSTQNSVKIAQVSPLPAPHAVGECVLCVRRCNARNLRFVSLAARGVQSGAAQRVDTLQL